MFKILGEYYYVDMDAIDEYTRIDSKAESEDGDEDHAKIHLIKYETVKFMMEIIMDQQDTVDEKMGLTSSELPLPFKLAFNTLLTKKIINKL
jgi:hypothetical protein